LVEGVRRIAPRAAQIAGGQTHEYARAAGARRFALDRIEDLVDRQHRFLTILCGWGVTSASGRAGGTTRPDEGRGTAFSIPRRASARKGSMSSRFTPTISIRSKSTRRFMANRGPKSV